MEFKLSKEMIKCNNNCEKCNKQNYCLQESIMFCMYLDFCKGKEKETVRERVSQANDS